MHSVTSEVYMATAPTKVESLIYRAKKACKDDGVSFDSQLVKETFQFLDQAFQTPVDRKELFAALTGDAGEDNRDNLWFIAAFLNSQSVEVENILSDKAMQTSLKKIWHAIDDSTLEIRHYHSALQPLFAVIAKLYKKINSKAESKHHLDVDANEFDTSDFETEDFELEDDVLESKNDLSPESDPSAEEAATEEDAAPEEEAPSLSTNHAPALVDAATEADAKPSVDINNAKDQEDLAFLQEFEDQENPEDLSNSTELEKKNDITNDITNEALIKEVKTMADVQWERKENKNFKPWDEQIKQLHAKTSLLRKNLDEIEARIRKMEVKDNQNLNSKDLDFIASIAEHLSQSGVRHPGILDAIAIWFGKLSDAPTKKGVPYLSLHQINSLARLFAEHRWDSSDISAKVLSLATHAMQNDAQAKNNNEVYFRLVDNLCYEIRTLSDKLNGEPKDFPCFTNFIEALGPILHNHPIMVKQLQPSSYLFREQTKRHRTPISGVRELLYIYDIFDAETLTAFNFNLNVAKIFTHKYEEKYYDDRLASNFEHDIVKEVVSPQKNLLKIEDTQFRRKTRQYSTKSGYITVYREKLIGPFHVDVAIIVKKTACLILEPGGEMYHHNYCLLPDGSWCYDLNGSSAFKQKVLSKFTEYPEYPENPNAPNKDTPERYTPIRVMTLCQSDLEAFCAENKISKDLTNEKERTQAYGKMIRAWLPEAILPKTYKSAFVLPKVCVGYYEKAFTIAKAKAVKLAQAEAQIIAKQKASIEAAKAKSDQPMGTLTQYKGAIAGKALTKPCGVAESAAAPMPNVIKSKALVSVSA